MTLAVKTVPARTWVIYEDGSGDAPTVQAGIDSAQAGDVVLVGPGTYYENLLIDRVNIHLKSQSGPEVTILDGSARDSSVVTIRGGLTNETVIEGFTVTGGSGTYYGYGGGISSVDAAPIIRGNIIRDNVVPTRGGGISLNSKPPLPLVVIEDNIIENNYSVRNAGGLNIAGSCIVQRNVFRANQTERGDGAGLYHLYGDHQLIIRENQFLGNIAGDHGGGIYIVNDLSPVSVQIIGNVFLGNQSSTLGTVDCSGAGLWVHRGAHIVQNTIAFNQATSRVFASGGGICLSEPPDGTVIERNIIAFNEECGVASNDITVGWEALIARNLVFGNEPFDFKSAFPEFNLIENVYKDPLFCGDGVAGDGEVAGISPAFSQPFGVIGAHSAPGCGPYDGTPVVPTTWGLLKTRYE
jgi:hypothetical protein